MAYVVPQGGSQVATTGELLFRDLPATSGALLFGDGSTAPPAPSDVTLAIAGAFPALTARVLAGASTEARITGQFAPLTVAALAVTSVSVFASGSFAPLTATTTASVSSNAFVSGSFAPLTVTAFGEYDSNTQRPLVRKGDWITYSKAGADGVVEEISLTTVKIRNFDNTIITVPPQTLVDDSFQNWKGMQESEGRRVKRKIYLDFRSVGFIDDTIRASLKDIIPEDKLKHEAVNMTLFRRYVEQWLLRRNEVNKEMLLMVRQLEATNTGLPVEFYFFLKDKEWSSYEHQLADIMEQIYAFAPKFGLEIYQQFTEK